MIDIILIFARGGGGGSGGDGGAGGILILPLIIGGIIVSWWIRKKRIARAKLLQKRALIGDSTWTDEIIQKRVGDVFYAFQKDWSEFNIRNMQAYLTPRYFSHISTMLIALKQMHRLNALENIKLKSVTLFGVEDWEVDELDKFSVEVNASMEDKLIDESNGNQLYYENSGFSEIWHFERENGQWNLDSISQIDRSGLVAKFDPVIDPTYLNFAQKNNLFYNADFGWLLLPLHGILFSQSRFGVSDINHHIIGVYHDVIIQLFQYLPVVKDELTLSDNFRHFYVSGATFVEYTVAHATLPKDYGNILVKRRSTFGLFGFKPKNLTKISLEWQRFNKLYSLYASDIDRVNSFELLHPVFMEKMAALPFKLNMEIIGYDLYLYTTDKKAEYQQMLSLLKDAFEEMKM